MQVTIIDDVSRDLHYAARMLRRSPSFTVIAILTLALGIGANTAIFSLVDAVLLKSLPVHEPERLVVVDTITPRGEQRNISYRLFQALRGERGVFAGVLAAQDDTNRFDLVGPEAGGAPEEAIVQLVSLAGSRLHDRSVSRSSAGLWADAGAYWVKRQCRGLAQAECRGSDAGGSPGFSLSHRSHSRWCC